MDEKKTKEQVVAELMDQVDLANKNDQCGVVDALLKKINRIQKRAKKGGKDV